MYSSLFYYIIGFIVIYFVANLVFSILGGIFAIFGPYIWILLLAWLIYKFYKNREMYRTMNDMRKAKNEFKKEWEDVTSSQEFKQGAPTDVVEAEYKIKEEE